LKVKVRCGSEEGIHTFGLMRDARKVTVGSKPRGYFLFADELVIPVFHGGLL
jgi:hypothetical protein